MKVNKITVNKIPLYQSIVKLVGKIFLIPTFLLLLISNSCSYKKKEQHELKGNIQKNSISSEIKKDSTVIKFSNISQILANSDFRWKNHSDFYGVQFTKNRLIFSFTQSCDYYFPIELKNDSIFVFWALDMDCTYDRFDKTLKDFKIPKVGDLFAKIVLSDSATLHIHYCYIDWVNAQNKRSENDTLFPTTLTTW